MIFNENKYIGILKNMYNSTYAINTYIYTLQNTENIEEMMKERDVLNAF